MCTSSSNILVILRIIRIIVPVMTFIIGLAFLYDRKMLGDNRKFEKYKKRYLHALIYSIVLAAILSLVIFIINSQGDQVINGVRNAKCSGIFVYNGYSDIHGAQLVHYSHYLLYYIIPIIIGIYALFTIVFELINKSKKETKFVIKTKIVELVLVSLIYGVLVISILAINTNRSGNRTNDEYNNGRWSESWKPIMYIYPKEDMDLTITFKKKENLMHTYPKYKDEWNIHVSTDGNIYDYDTNRNYYALYWDEKDYQEENFNEGFVVKGEDISKFFEEKLEILGFNEREINEFIIYWMPKMEDNKYNLIRFRTTDEISENMPIDFSIEPDTLIRVIMDYKKLDEKIEIKEQKLPEYKRQGFTIVEWGGRELD